jgi:hypothetical protein
VRHAPDRAADAFPYFGWGLDVAGDGRSSSRRRRPGRRPRRRTPTPAAAGSVPWPDPGARAVVLPGLLPELHLVGAVRDEPGTLVGQIDTGRLTASPAPDGHAAPVRTTLPCRSTPDLPQIVKLPHTLGTRIVVLDNWGPACRFSPTAVFSHVLSGLTPCRRAPSVSAPHRPQIPAARSG